MQIIFMHGSTLTNGKNMAWNTHLPCFCWVDLKFILAFYQYHSRSKIVSIYTVYKQLVFMALALVLTFFRKYCVWGFAWDRGLTSMQSFRACAAVFKVIYEQRERMFHRDIQTRENNVWKHERENMASQMNRDVTECFRLLIWIQFLTKHNVIRNSIQVILHA